MDHDFQEFFPGIAVGKTMGRHEMSQDEQTIWAQRAAERIVDGVLTVSERLPRPDQIALLREIARRAIWHMPNSRYEIRELVRYFDIENPRKLHPGDEAAPEA
jgi:hypothetical protein